MPDWANGQKEVFAFLADPASHGGAKVRRIDTHAASVFLAGDRALKIKRAVRFPFLDYSTLAKRKHACEAELAVNAPFAPEIYRRVIPITREGDGHLALAGQGAPVEWAVEMRRFDETRTLDNLVEIDKTLADALGGAVAAAHERAPVVAAPPWIAALESYLEQNLEAFRDRPDLFEPAAVFALDRDSRESYRRICPLLAARGELGRVRRGHGDLHLGNIVLIEGLPVLFDAVEFDPLIAAGDVLYDLSFLLMDLCARGVPEAANVVLNSYLAKTRRIEDLDGLAALPFFLSMRAAIRAKVTAARIAPVRLPFAPAEKENQRDSQREKIAAAARAYFGFARQAIKALPPRLIAIGGLSGTGKTRLARALAAHIAPLPGAIIVRSDIERKALFGAGETERLPEVAYAPAANERVYAALIVKARRIIAAGHSAIVDAVFARPLERRAIAAAAKSANVDLHGLFLTAKLATRLARIGERALDASDADQTVARAQQYYDLGSLEWAQVDASGTAEETLARARSALD